MNTNLLIALIVFLFLLLLLLRYVAIPMYVRLSGQTTDIEEKKEDVRRVEGRLSRNTHNLQQRGARKSQTLDVETKKRLLSKQIQDKSDTEEEEEEKIGLTQTDEQQNKPQQITKKSNVEKPDSPPFTALKEQKRIDLTQTDEQQNKPQQITKKLNVEKPDSPPLTVFEEQKKIDLTQTDEEQNKPQQTDVKKVDLSSLSEVEKKETNSLTETSKSSQEDRLSVENLYDMVYHSHMPYISPASTANPLPSVPLDSQEFDQELKQIGLQAYEGKAPDIELSDTIPEAEKESLLNYFAFEHQDRYKYSYSLQNLVSSFLDRLYDVEHNIFNVNQRISNEMVATCMFHFEEQYKQQISFDDCSQMLETLKTKLVDEFSSWFTIQLVQTYKTYVQQFSGNDPILHFAWHHRSIPSNLLEWEFVLLTNNAHWTTFRNHVHQEWLHGAHLTNKNFIFHFLTAIFQLRSFDVDEATIEHIRETNQFKITSCSYIMQDRQFMLVAFLQWLSNEFEKPPAILPITNFFEQMVIDMYFYSYFSRYQIFSDLYQNDEQIVFWNFPVVSDEEDNYVEKFMQLFDVLTLNGTHPQTGNAEILRAAAFKQESIFEVRRFLQYIRMKVFDFASNQFQNQQFGEFLTTEQLWNMGVGITTNTNYLRRLCYTNVIREFLVCKKNLIDSYVGDELKQYEASKNSIIAEYKQLSTQLQNKYGMNQTDPIINDLNWEQADVDIGTFQQHYEANPPLVVYPEGHVDIEIEDLPPVRSYTNIVFDKSGLLDTIWDQLYDKHFGTIDEHIVQSILSTHKDFETEAGIALRFIDRHETSLPSDASVHSMSSVYPNFNFQTEEGKNVAEKFSYAQKQRLVHYIDASLYNSVRVLLENEWEIYQFYKKWITDIRPELPYFSTDILLNSQLLNLKFIIYRQDRVAEIVESLQFLIAINDNLETFWSTYLLINSHLVEYEDRDKFRQWLLNVLKLHLTLHIAEYGEE